MDTVLELFSAIPQFFKLLFDGFFYIIDIIFEMFPFVIVLPTALLSEFWINLKYYFFIILNFFVGMIVMILMGIYEALLSFSDVDNAIENLILICVIALLMLLLSVNLLLPVLVYFFPYTLFELSLLETNTIKTYDLCFIVVSIVFIIPAAQFIVLPSLAVVGLYEFLKIYSMNLVHWAKTYITNIRKIDNIKSFIKSILYWPIYVMTYGFWTVFCVYNTILQCMVCPALLYSFKGQVETDNSDKNSDTLTFSWGGMFHSAGMNAQHFNDPNYGLHIAFSHRFALSKEALITTYVNEIKVLLKKHPNKIKLNFCGYSLGGSIVTEVLIALMKDKIMDNENLTVNLVLDRTFKSFDEVIIKGSEKQLSPTSSFIYYINVIF